ncbi:Ig-like domain-containing protein, partial [Crocosphaera watsonii]|uniref:Ig-like domain-containing protein n=1 Tax=Crocosphaera watsonii TaxID=263511 RepID=UPI000650BC14
NLNTDGSFEYIPNANFNGTDTFTYQANDGELNSSPATVTITVNPVNDAPVASDDQYSVDEDTTLTIETADGVLGNDTDVDGDTLTSLLVDAPNNGNLTLNTDGSFEYVPNANFNGTDTFTYQANDGTDDSNIATVTIIVNDVPIGAEPPVFGSLGDETLDASVTPGFDGVDDLAFSGAGNDFIDTESGEGVTVFMDSQETIP